MRFPAHDPPLYRRTFVYSNEVGGFFAGGSVVCLARTSLAGQTSTEEPGKECLTTLRLVDHIFLHIRNRSTSS